MRWRAPPRATPRIALIIIIILRSGAGTGVPAAAVRVAVLYRATIEFKSSSRLFEHPSSTC